jgi:single-strand DNA-binding protein
MGKDLNKVQLTGHLGADPEIRYITNENNRAPRRDDKPAAVTTFRVASNRSWKDRNGEAHEDTEWFRVVAWDRLAEICAEYLNKGTRVYVEGRLQTRKYTDRDGVERYTSEVVAQDMIILSARGERANVPDMDDSYGDADEAPAPPPTPARRAPAPSASPAPSRAPAPAPSRAPARAPARNQPQPIESDDDIPF